MTLARAFIERARLTKEYEKISSLIQSVDFNLETDGDTGEVIKNPKISLDQLLEMENILGNVLADFNAAIDKANANSEARNILSKLTHLRRRGNLVKRLVSAQDNFQSERKEFDNYAYDVNGNRGVYVIKTYKPASDVDFSHDLVYIEREIRDLEDRLSEINSTTKVELSADLENALNQVFN